jgi:hypothetical protein
LEGLHTRKAVGHAYVLAIILSEEHTDYSPLGALGLSAIVVCGGKKHKRRDRDVAGHERQRFCCGGGHADGVFPISPMVLLVFRRRRRRWWVLKARGDVVIVDAALRWPC